MSEEGEVGRGGEEKGREEMRMGEWEERGSEKEKARMRVKGKGRKEIEEILKVGEKRAQRVRGK